jgi:DNA (cytosine-5)-methyltransferase 1
MTKLKVLDLFSGIGGFSLGLERTGGFSTVAFCEIEPFPRKVLAKHWPEVPCYEDVTKLTGDILLGDGISVDVITGGFPCQDISCAGKQAGIGEGTRSGLWSEIVRLIGELSPRYVVVENVAALLSGPGEQRGGWFGRILGDLAEVGYDAEWHVIPSSYVGGWSERSRVWVLAYPFEKFRERRTLQPVFRQSSLSVELCGGVEEWPGRSALPDTRFCRKGNGIPHRLDRLAGIGNAVDPKIPELIGRAILQTEAAL